MQNATELSQEITDTAESVHHHIDDLQLSEAEMFLEELWNSVIDDGRNHAGVKAAAQKAWEYLQSVDSRSKSRDLPSDDYAEELVQALAIAANGEDDSNQ